jgi:hypothetical protein
LLVGGAGVVVFLLEEADQAAKFPRGWAMNRIWSPRVDTQPFGLDEITRPP